MEALDVEGVFWLAQRPDNQVAGRLTFDAQNGVELSLIGTFHDVDEILSSHSGQSITLTDRELLGTNDRSVRIIGSTTKGSVTIDDCSVVGSSFTLGSTHHIPHQKYDGLAVFLNAQFEDECAPPEISGIKVSIRNLEHWLSKSGVRVVFLQGDDTSPVRLDRIDIDLPDNLALDTGTDELEFSFQGVLRGDHIAETIIEQNCQFTICKSEMHPYEDLLKVCTSLQDLITIGLDEPSVITSMSVRLPRPNSSENGDEEAAQWVRLYTKLLGTDIKPRKKSLDAINTLFSFDDIGGMDGVRGWLEVARRFDVVVGSLMRHWYIPSMYAQDRFFNSVVAAEAMARIRIGEQDVNLRRELTELAEYAGDVFSTLVGDVETWSRSVVRVRVNNIVHIGLRQDIGRPVLYLLSESLYFLVVFCLLRECGVSNDALSKIGGREKVRRLSSQISNIDWQSVFNA